MATVYIEKEQCDHVMIKNQTGAIVAQYEFAVILPFAAIADEAVAIAAVGSFHVEQGILVQASNLQTSEDTFATVGQSVYFDTSTKKFSDTLTVGYYRVGYLVTAKNSAGVIVFEKARYASVVPASTSDLEAAITAATALSGIPFRKTAVLTSALATTPVDLLTSDEVGAGKKAYITSMLASVGGTAVWAGTGTVVLVRDKAASPVTAITMAKAQLGANAQLVFLSTGVTLATPVRTGAGMTAAKGLEVVADGTFETTGSDLSVTVCGFIA